MEKKNPNIYQRALDIVNNRINPDIPQGGGSAYIAMRVSGGYIQYTTDNVNWVNLIAVADLKGDAYTLTDADKQTIVTAVVDALPKYNGGAR